MMVCWSQNCYLETLSVESVVLFRPTKSTNFLISLNAHPCASATVVDDFGPVFFLIRIMLQFHLQKFFLRFQLFLFKVDTLALQDVLHLSTLYFEIDLELLHFLHC